ncbi:OmpA family protein [Vibrio sinensis]|uniref:OmpA family protein n=1 Tax=Vibrio sinensis TaxID=2302434 RepID=A0A3A6R739_9VIBR|nr:OmpA family protein [Vibrio sinensis]RJX72852.1 OmpA family protein [Vibrio sinensis]
MFKQLFLITACAAAISTYANADEEQYDYITTPDATQVADLLDDDKDGVINARDLCTGTPRNSQVDNDGCGEIIELEEKLGLHILFPNDSSEIEPLFKNQIEQMSRFLKEFPKTSIEIQGYASKVGKAEYNLNLSKRRALEVERALEQNGIASNRITIVGFGATNLEAQGDDEVSHAQNRKVVASVIGHKGSVKEEWTIFTKKAK